VQTIKRFLSNCKIIDINRSIKDTAINIRKSNKLKLPDAIIAATTLYLNIPLITADKGFKNIDDIISVIVDF
jgi:predicted nucleic acid-binding protein